MKKKITAAVLTITLCLALIAGSTYALFTSEDKVDISVNSGEVDVNATILDKEMVTYSLGEEQEHGKFANGGTARFTTEKVLELKLVTPGDKVEFAIQLTNESTVEIQYRLTWTVAGELAKHLVINTDGQLTTDWAAWKTTDAKEKVINVSIELPAEFETQGLTDASISFKVEAVQANGKDLYGKTIVESAEDLAEALKNGGSIILIDDVNAEAATTAPYGNKYAFKLDGATLDGNGNELYMECYGDDYGIMTSGGTIKNLTITEGCRAVMIMYPESDIILDNVNIGGDGVLYPINTGEAGEEGVKLIVTNSTLAGWTSYSNIESASFTNVTFKQGTYYNNIYGRVLKPYVNTTLTNCSFIEHMNLDLSGLTQGQKVIMDNCTVNGQAITDYSVFTVPATDKEYDTELFTVDLPSWATDVADCVVFREEVSSADGLIENLEKGNDIVLENDVKIDPAGMSNAYGTTGINVKNGQTIDGNGNTLDIKGAGGTWDSGISTTGGVIKNITITGSFRGVFVNHNSDHSETVILENVIIDGTTYTISCDQGSYQNLEAYNSTFNGWTSYAATIGTVKFVDCSFGEGNGYAFCRPYAATTFVNCNFEAGFLMDPRAEVTFENCYLDGVLITAENVDDLVYQNLDKVTVK